MLWKPYRAPHRLIARLGLRYQTHFQRLGISESATRAEVRVAFLSLAKRLHPDVSARKDLAAAQRDFVALKAAYDVLSDADSRARYTATLSRGADSLSHADDDRDGHAHAHSQHHDQHHQQRQHQQQWQHQRGARTDLVSYTVGTWAQLERELEVTIHDPSSTHRKAQCSSPSLLPCLSSSLSPSLCQSCQAHLTAQPLDLSKPFK